MPPQLPIRWGREWWRKACRPSGLVPLTSRKLKRTLRGEDSSPAAWVAGFLGWRAGADLKRHSRALQLPLGSSTRAWSSSRRKPRRPGKFWTWTVAPEKEVTCRRAPWPAACPGQATAVQAWGPMRYKIF